MCKTLIYESNGKQHLIYAKFGMRIKNIMNM